MTGFFRRIAFGLVIGALTAPVPHPASAQAVHPGKVERIVSIGGALTETVFALGMGARVVGVDSTSTYPQAATRLPKVGYARTLGAEAVMSLAPTLILASEDAGPPEAIDHLRRTGVDVRVIPVGHAPERVPAMISAVADTLGVPQRGSALRACVASQLESVMTRAAALPKRPRVLFLLGTGGGDILASGRGTRADAMIALAGGINAVQGYQGYKPLTAESAVAAQPEVLLVTTEGLQSAGGVDALRRNAGLAATPAMQHNAVEHQDSLFLLGFGPRTGLAVRWLATRLHPREAWSGPEPVRCAGEAAQ